MKAESYNKNFYFKFKNKGLVLEDIDTMTQMIMKGL